MNATLRRTKPHGALIVSGCVTSAKIMGHIEKSKQLSDIAMLHNIERHFGVYVSTQVINALRNAQQSSCEVCLSRFYGTKHQQTCSIKCQTSQVNSSDKQKQTQKGRCRKIKLVAHDPQWQWLYQSKNAR